MVWKQPPPYFHIFYHKIYFEIQASSVTLAFKNQIGNINLFFTKHTSEKNDARIEMET
jgi:hypothetical protein